MLLPPYYLEVILTIGMACIVTVLMYREGSYAVSPQATALIPKQSVLPPRQLVIPSRQSISFLGRQAGYSQFPGS